MSFEDICERLKTLMLEYFIETDKIIDNIITDDSTKVLSAKQGVVLKELIDNKTPVLVDNATLKVCEEPDVPVEGYEVGDKYVDFLLFTEEEEHIYCLLTEFVKCDGLEFSSNKVTEITNESTHEQYPSAKSVYNFHDSSKVSVDALDESVTDLGFIKTHPVQADWGETDPTKLSYIIGKPNIHSILVGKVADVVVENGKLKVTRFEESDIPTGNKFITLISSSQYVTSGESFILHVVLVNEDGAGVIGETIRLTGSDGSSYSNITNNQGVCTFNIFSINEDVTFTVTYESLSSSVTVEYCLYYDYGTETRHKTPYLNEFNNTFYEDNYTKLVNSSNAWEHWRPFENIDINNDSAIEISWDKPAYNGGNTAYALVCLNNSSSLQPSFRVDTIFGESACKCSLILRDKKLYSAIDGVEVERYDYSSTDLKNIYFMFQCKNTDHYFKFNNLKVKEIE